VLKLGKTALGNDWVFLFQIYFFVDLLKLVLEMFRFWLWWWVVFWLNFRCLRRLWTIRSGRLCSAEKSHTNRLICQTLN